MKEIQARPSLQLLQMCSQIKVQDHIKQLQFLKLYLKHLTFVLSLCKNLYIYFNDYDWREHEFLKAIFLLVKTKNSAPF